MFVAVREPLQPTYDGPYLVIKRYEKNFQIERDGRKIRISADRLKPTSQYDGRGEGKTDFEEETSKKQPNNSETKTTTTSIRVGE